MQLRRTDHSHNPDIVSENKNKQKSRNPPSTLPQIGVSWNFSEPKLRYIQSNVGGNTQVIQQIFRLLN